MKAAQRLFALGLALSACAPAQPSDVAYPWTLPAGFPQPAVPESNPMSVEKARLGRFLFYDTRLSVNGLYACATCHRQGSAFAAGAPRALGCTGQEGHRNAMSLTNVAYNSAYGWANNSLRTLEQFVVIPLYSTNPVELGLADRDAEVVARLQEDARYPNLFRAAFPSDPRPVTMANVQLALTSFLRTLLSADSPYDRSLAGDATALSESAQRGRDLFFGDRLECYHCHGGFNFSDASTRAGARPAEVNFHNTGLYNLGGTGAFPALDQGLSDLTHDPNDTGAFRAPTLRNIEVTGPYFHDGSAATLDDVLDHYAAGGRTIATGPNAGVGSESPYRSSLVSGFTLAAQERQDLLAFLRSLTDRTFLTDVRLSNPFLERTVSVDSSACPSYAPASCASSVPSWRGQLAPVVQSRCASCHQPGGPAARWPLTSRAEVVLFQSPSLLRVSRCDMPPSASPPLSRSEHAALVTWLSCGAPDN